MSKATEPTESSILAGQVPLQLASHTVAGEYNITGMTPADFVRRHGGATRPTDSSVIAGQRPLQLASHTVAGEYNITGMTPADFVRRHGGATRPTDSSVIAGQRPLQLASHTVAGEYNITGMTPADFVRRHGGATRPTNSSVIADQRPLQLMSHTTAREYIIKGITPEDFIGHHGGAELNFKELQKEFKKHCADYMEDLTVGSISEAAVFCMKIVYEIGPECRNGLGSRGKVLKFIFRNDGIEHFVFVTSSKNQNEPTDCCMFLDINEAGLICMDTFSRISNIIYEAEDCACLLTPLAAASFEKDDIPDFSKAYQVAPVTLISMINQSCEPDGQCLPYSDPNIAIVARLALTRNVKNQSLRKSIINKLQKQYIAVGKMPSEDKIKAAAPYGIGVISAEFSLDEMIEPDEVEQERMSLLKKCKLMKDSQISSKVLVPHLGKWDMHTIERPKSL